MSPSLRVLVCMAGGWIASGDVAAAQSRLFSCAHARYVELTVTGPDTVSANPIDGKPMKMKRDSRNPLRFFNGDYAVTLTPNQGSLKLEIPDWGSTNCLFGSVNVKPFLPAAGSASVATSCGPGFHPVPETDRCDPDPGTPPTAQPPLWASSCRRMRRARGRAAGSRRARRSEPEYAADQGPSLAG